MATPKQVTDKMLIPGKFGFTATAVGLSTLESKIRAGLKHMKLTPAVNEYCLTLLNNSKNGYQSFNVQPYGLSPQEIGIILKDFGELTGAAYMLKTQKKYASVKFPVGNEKLIDYILVTKDGTEEKFSAKAGQGGKPSVTAVTPVIKKFEKEGNITGKYKIAAKVLDFISTEEKNGLFLGPLKAAYYLKTPGYMALIAVLKKLKVHSGDPSSIPTSEQLLDAVNKAGSYNSCMKEFAKFFSESGYSANLNAAVTKRLIETPREGKEKKWGVLHYPITAELIKWLNTDSNKAKELLTMAANTLTVTQVYLDRDSGSGVKYRIKGFSDAEFMFGSPSSMPRPTNNRIGFTMKKASTKK
jgi:hypothetical protein